MRRRAGLAPRRLGQLGWSGGFALSQGLSERESFFTIQRDGGEQWECLFAALPPIHNVKAAVV